MGFGAMINQGKIYPILTCDTCGKPIKNLNKAIAVFTNVKGENVLPMYGVYHKVKCDPQNQPDVDFNHKDHPFWRPLDKYLEQLQQDSSE